MSHITPFNMKIKETWVFNVSIKSLLNLGNLPNPHSKRPQNELDMQGRCCKISAVSRQFSFKQAFKKPTATNAVTPWAVICLNDSINCQKTHEKSNTSLKARGNHCRPSSWGQRETKTCAMHNAIFGSNKNRGSAPCYETEKYACWVQCSKTEWLQRNTNRETQMGPLTQTDLSASSWLHINIAKRTNN